MIDRVRMWIPGCVALACALLPTFASAQVVVQGGIQVQGSVGVAPPPTAVVVAPARPAVVVQAAQPQPAVVVAPARPVMVAPAVQPVVVAPQPQAVAVVPPAAAQVVFDDGDPTNDVPMGVATVAPPPPYQEVQTAAPQPGFVWVSGNWVWRGNRWAWRRGRWIRPQVAGAAWVPGHWSMAGGRYHWQRGRWAGAPGGVAVVQPAAAPGVVVAPAPPAVVVGPGRGHGHGRMWVGPGRRTVIVAPAR